MLKKGNLILQNFDMKRDVEFYLRNKENFNCSGSLIIVFLLWGFPLFNYKNCYICVAFTFERLEGLRYYKLSIITCVYLIKSMRNVLPSRYLNLLL